MELLFSQKDNNDIIFIAGSILPIDEKHLMPSLVKLMIKYKNLRAVLVPHELHESHKIRFIKHPVFSAI